MHRDARATPARYKSSIEADDLYGLPLERFITERNALAKELRREGHNDAARIAKLPRPSIAAWAVNQLVRTERDRVGGLFAAGDAVQSAQRDLLAGQGDARAMRAATERERAAVDELVEAARQLLSSGDHKPTQVTLERVSDTLHAAALDENARAKVREGCIDRELRHVGVGLSGEVAIAGRGGGARSSPSVRPPTEDDGNRAEAARLERDRSARLKAARKAEAEAHRITDRAERDVKRAEAGCERAEQAFREAEQALVEARARAHDAALAHQHAQRALEAI
jgi:hypothetical protein